jgi:hypothetical protein
MAFTYDKSQLDTSHLFRARFQLGDTDHTNPLVDDDEINALITVYGYAEGVAQVADGLVSKFAQEPDEYEDEGGVKVKWGQKIKVWQDLARRLRDGIAKVDPSIVRSPMIGTLTSPDLTGMRP